MEPSQPRPPAPPPVLTIVWAAILMSHVLLVVVGFAVPGNDPPVPWAPVLGLAALGPATLSVQAGMFARTVQSLQAWFILRFALAEAAGVLGLAAWLLSGDRMVQLGCAAIGLLAHAMAFPSARAQAAFEERR